MSDVTVVGAGVVGLTTALVLEERGHAVRIVADAAPTQITSAVAGAVWFPYRAGPPDKVAAWAQRTRAWLESLASDRAAGIDVLTGYEITPETTLDITALPRPWWAGAGALARAPAAVTHAPAAWQFSAPRAEPALHLAWLHAQLRATVEHRRVTDLDAEPGDVVINCTGLRARELSADPHLGALFGQTVITEPGTVDLATTITDDRDPDAIFYVIPRRTELVLGGCSLPHDPATPPVADPAITARILAQAAALGLHVGPVRAVRVGLRPFRAEVRLERAGRLIHNYGHGGAGFTLARGCAEAVAALI